MIWKLPRGPFDLSRQGCIMGVLNVTPDSFSDGGSFLDRGAAVEHALELVRQGADIIDVGGESTRPGAESVGVDEELRRVLPVIRELRARSDVFISIDTSKAAVAEAATEAGADIINDVTALLGDPAMPEVAARSGAGVVLMHMQGEPRTMQLNPHYEDVVREVRDFLAARAQVLVEAGIAPARIVLDPGFGFGKTVGQNYVMLRRLDEMRVGDYPWLIGVSRKSMLGHVVGREPRERLAASLAAALYGVEKGGHILRVHDVAETVDAVKVWRTIKDESFV
jgi:dihydropteroate synthase